ncbi:hypothetical protein, conserved [Trypanosoma brucei gambiense DAL972]|uniref:Uncharacterized protein n=1 Tax=Trypanosoma brucei gambiense (strain MHOM/CI/86/DAL972) TaxID=679716 RepID=D0A891_TRYB9|nr:hypothetical protein, conserved [Trypanosoma brucei gambiense DAL972]CBH17892.1 hypothetical protein, conserved [Trypanosoma brucei gambiense DAL972]|eukprot:XP_011780156.1 hypothetical protein, conserved [Trypanosoma brucei gambiense DAL972]
MPKRHRQPDASFLTPPSHAYLEQVIEDYGDCHEDSDSCASNEFFSRRMGDDGNHSSSVASLTDCDATSSDASSVDDDEADSGDVTVVDVDFGVFDIREQDVNAIMHLMDQFCPDRMNEVDREDLGTAFLKSPFTCIVKISNDYVCNDDIASSGGEEEGGVEEDVYGVASVLDLAHDSRLGSLLNLLKTDVWRTVSPGVLPTELLTTLEEKTGRAKCVFLVGEYIRNVPLELTSHILTDLAKRFEETFGRRVEENLKSKQGKDVIHATFPCIFAVLSKIQRATDSPSADTGAEASAADRKEGRDKSLPQKRKKRTVTQQHEELDMKRYVFWREEDSVLYEFREKHVAVVAYRCRPQYDMQPENDIPISILYAITYKGLQEAIAEIEKRETARASVLHY